MSGRARNPQFKFTIPNSSNIIPNYHSCLHKAFHTVTNNYSQWKSALWHGTMKKNPEFKLRLNNSNSVKLLPIMTRHVFCISVWEHHTRKLSHFWQNFLTSLSDEVTGIMDTLHFSVMDEMLLKMVLTHNPLATSKILGVTWGATLLFNLTLPQGCWPVP